MSRPGVSAMPATKMATKNLPGVALCIVITLASIVLERIEAAVFGRAWVEALVLAILLGAAVRTAWTPGPLWSPGVRFSAKMLLEIAVVLLGASVSAATILAIGVPLLVGVALLVAAAVLGGYGLARLLGLPRRMAILVASGNAICGNSAIAAVAPVIGADGDEIASSIAFTAVLGVVVVLVLPLLIPVFGLSQTQFGVLAGVTVYAVPQVLAATTVVGPQAVGVGTLVKLVRVLMLGPLVLALSLLTPRLREAPDEPPPHVTTGPRTAPGRPKLHQLVPWFIIGFLVLLMLRSIGLIPGALLPGIAWVTGTLTVISMAALGLGVDVRTVARAGGRVTLAVTISLVALCAIGLTMIRLLAIS